MKSFGQPPRFANQQMKGGWKLTCSWLQSMCLWGPRNLSSTQLCYFRLIRPCFLGAYTYCRLFLVFSPAVYLFASHQATSAQGYGLLSTGKSNPCKPHTLSKTKCSSAVTQATKCLRWAVARLQKLSRAFQSRRAAGTCLSASVVFPSHPVSLPNILAF